MVTLEMKRECLFFHHSTRHMHAQDGEILLGGTSLTCLGAISTTKARRNRRALMIEMRTMTRTTRILFHFFGDFGGLMNTSQFNYPYSIQNLPVKHADHLDRQRERITTEVGAC